MWIQKEHKAVSVFLSLILCAGLVFPGVAEETGSISGPALGAVLTIIQVASGIEVAQVKTVKRITVNTVERQETLDVLEAYKQKFFERLHTSNYGYVINHIVGEYLDDNGELSSSGKFSFNETDLDELEGLIKAALNEMEQRQDEYRKATGTDLIDPSELERLKKLRDRINEYREKIYTAEENIHTTIDTAENRSDRDPAGQKTTNIMSPDSLKQDLRGASDDLNIDFDKLSFTDEYSYTYEEDSAIDRGTEHMVTYCNKDGFVVRITIHQEYEWGCVSDQEWRNMPINGSYEMIASVFTEKMTSPYGDSSSCRYYVTRGGILSEVDKNGNPVDPE